ncbi:C2 calcium-dependent domain-containing protein 4C isoform X1 [Boleophthalmus pectinirostris]|uniref:C2 calcium-dependent domain-containing protein 4C isoform X1 n=2 Tax=Boleophthalmus pectinirostris TaxID=150288 RepID=UPI00242DC1EF|nr:C2 calcium-dependent domain-containing protein 4C isoform X1 [Boleophthalmus pectinirostris]XP_055020415.1 C2 calcium-dependent domain-containing protein 4C isoform X1 [Boleophthalmus pectinirostris]XP_055020416.1 C2 calcium-dependent domain-containing protein 4C isoform X1 [Boleophthalmus pectinirostris]
MKKTALTVQNAQPFCLNLLFYCARLTFLAPGLHFTSINSQKQKHLSDSDIPHLPLCGGAMWVLDKLRGSVETNVLRQGENGDKKNAVAPTYTNVLTPDKIPDFFIPPKLVSCPPEPEIHKPKEEVQPSTSEQTIGSGKKISSPRSPRLVAKIAGDTKNLLRAANRHIIQIESADDIVAGDTNADPQSQTAMSLPYVPKTQTSYGFATLKESPHTRRKESLFHCEVTSPMTSPNTQRRTQGKGSEGGNHLNPADCNPSHMNPYRYFSGGESDTCSSAESSPFSSPLLSRSASLLKIFTHETQAKVVKAKRTFARHSSLSTDECSSAEPSPNVQRRLHVPSLHGSSGASDHGLQREHIINLHKGGTVRISANYDTSTSRLLIRVLAAENLYDKHFDIKSINCCVSVYLNPGKLQKQRSNIIKNSRNPVFKEDFFFDSISSVQVKTLSVKFKVVNKGTSLKRDTLLGEREVPLTKLLSGL